MKKIALLAVIVVAPLVGAVPAQPPQRPKNQDSGAAASQQPNANREQAQAESKKPVENQPEQKTLNVYYLEIVTPSVNETCVALEKTHGVTFGKPDAGLGGARTAPMPGGGMVGVRAPMRETEAPVVRPYWLVKDIKAAVAAAQKAGGQVAMEATEIPGHGMFAIYVLGGIDHGLWQH